MSWESTSETSEPPPASVWAAPPEFYVDENSVVRRIVRSLRDLGYLVHTPAELYGGRELACGAPDDDWLPRVGRKGWVVIGRDVKIFERPWELAAYRQAKIHVFLLPGQAVAQQMCELVEMNLSAMCAAAAARKPGVWKLTKHGLDPY